MRKNMGKHFVVWIRLKTLKRVMLSLCLLAMLVAVMSYEACLPPRRQVIGACRWRVKSLPLMQDTEVQMGER